MNILCIKNSTFQGDLLIRQWATQNNHNVTVTSSCSIENYHHHHYECVIILGGPQNLKDLPTYNEFTPVIEFTKKCLKSNVFILGICLGAQIIGEAYGFRTIQSDETEVGFYPIELNEQGKNDPLFSNINCESFQAFHWHYDMPGIESQEQILGQSSGCSRQIIKYSDSAYGLQFHLESTYLSLREMTNNIFYPDRSQDRAPFVQTKEEILSFDLNILHQTLFQVLDNIERILATTQEQCSA